MTVAIQLFVPTFRVDECLTLIKDCLEKGWTGLGYRTVELEDEWKKYTGLDHAHYLNSATAGLSLAVEILKKSYGWSDGDEVISTPLTFVSTNHVILYHNLKVVFADVDEYLCLDPVDVEKKITSKTKAILFVGMGGNTGQYQRIVEICEKYKLKLILDAAHMAGTRLNGIIPGKEADVVVYSFQAVKNLPTADSGMICFKEQEHDAQCRKLAWLGINKDTYSRTNDKGAYKWKYDVDEIGYKYHGNSIIASIGLVQLKYLDQDNAYRRQIASWYDSNLSDCPHLKAIPTPKGCESSRHLYCIRVRDREEVILELQKNEIYPGVHYRDNTEYPMYSNENYMCINAQTMSREIISLPMHLRLTKKDIDYICTVIKEIVQKKI